MLMLSGRYYRTGVQCGVSLGDERANRNRLMYPLQTVQNDFHRTITGAYKTTSVPGAGT